METKLLEEIRDIIKQGYSELYLWALPDIARYLNVSEARCRQLIKQDDFPAPVKLLDEKGSVCKRWVSGDIKRWIEVLQFKQQSQI